MTLDPRVSSLLAAAANETERSSSNAQLIIAALLAIAAIVVLIAGSAVLGIVARHNLADTLASFSAGFGSTAAGSGRTSTPDPARTVGRARDTRLPT